MSQLTNITACSLIPPPSAYSNTNLKLSTSSQSYFCCSVNIYIHAVFSFKSINVNMIALTSQGTK